MAKSLQETHLTPETVCGGTEGHAVREMMTKVGDKWTILLILCLSNMPGGRARFSELNKVVPGISQRMLTLTLRNLERDGMVIRELFPEVPPRVEYELTPLGLSLLNPLQALMDWVGTNWQEIKKVRHEYDAVHSVKKE